MACICFMLCACGTNREVSVPEAMESLTVAKTEGMSGETASLTPSATSEDLNLYSYALPNGPVYAVDKLGQYEERYAVDGKGNLTDSDGNVLIAAENVLRYRPIHTMYFSQDRYSLQAERAALYSVRDQEPQKLYSYCDAELYCAPSSATNGVICLGSSAGTLIDILPDRNARLANIDRKLLNSDEIAIEADDLSHPIRLYIRVLSPLAGDAVITARSLDNSASGTGCCAEPERHGICQRFRQPGQSCPYLHEICNSAYNQQYRLYDLYLQHLRLLLSGRVHFQAHSGGARSTRSYSQLYRRNRSSFSNGPRIYTLCM